MFGRYYLSLVTICKVFFMYGNDDNVIVIQIGRGGQLTVA